MDKKLKAAVARFTEAWRPTQYEPTLLRQTEINKEFKRDLLAIIRVAKAEARDRATDSSFGMS
jgi:hypothetical protein